MALDVLSHSPVYVVGAAETMLGKVPDQTELSMIALAAREALDEAGLRISDIDGVFCTELGPASSVQVAEYLGIEPRFVDSSDHGGGQYEAFINHAIQAIATEVCQVALVCYASRQRSDRSRSTDMATYMPGLSLTKQFESPIGLPMPIGHFALVAARHMHLYGTTGEQLAEVAVAARKWAQLNPKAWQREPLTIGDVLKSPLLCTPLHKLDCCLITDGGGCLILTGASRARNAAKRPIRILGASESAGTFHMWQAADITRWPGQHSGPQAFAMAGITHGDVDVFEPYDAFTINVLIQLEDLGFCPRGESGRFVENGRLAPGGALPAMTSGGGLSYNHPGLFGIMPLIESVRQLRHEAGARQVENAKIAVAHGAGGMFWIGATTVLARE